MTQASYQKLEQRFRRIGAIDDASSVLHWDMAAMMPRGGAEARAEQLAALHGVAHRLLVDADLEADGVVSREIELLQGHTRYLHPVDEAALGRDVPGGELAVLRAFELPPARRIDAALVTEVAGRGPGADQHVVDPDADVRRPVGVGPRHLGRDLHAELDRLDLGLGDLGVVRELVFDVTAAEPQQCRLHAAGIEEQVGHVEKPDDAVGRAEPAGRAHLVAGVEAERHRDLDHVVLLLGREAVQPDEDLVEAGRADLLLALACLDRLGADQS